MRPSNNVSAFSRWTTWIISRTARQAILLRNSASVLSNTRCHGAKGLVSLPGSQKQQQRVSVVRDWIHERGKHMGKPYPCNVITFPENRVWLGYVTFRLPRRKYFVDDRVDVFIDFSPPDTRHPRCFAVKAMPEDPASRLALRVKGEIIGEGSYEDYVHSTGGSVVFKANALTDMLLDTASREEILQRPRRSWNTRVRPPRMKKIT